MEMILIVFFICIIGCGWSSYNLGFKQGIRQGAENTVDVLHEQKIIRYNHKGEIIPYK